MVELRKPAFRLLLLIPFAVGSLAPTCSSEPCAQRLTPDGTADFSTLRLQGKLLCNASSKCEATFQGTEATIVVEDESGRVHRLVYDLQHAGTHAQTQNVTTVINPGGKGACLTSQKYRRETWTVPTVTLTLKSATRDGQPLPLDEATLVGRKPSAWYPRLDVVTHYVDRKTGDQYMGVLVRGQEVQVADSLEMAITRNGQRFQIGPGND